MAGRGNRRKSPATESATPPEPPRTVNFGKRDTLDGFCSATQRTEADGQRRTMYLLTTTWDTKMSDNKVVPFRRRESKPSATEVDMYRKMTRNWSEEMRRLMFPTYAEFDSESGQREAE